MEFSRPEHWSGLPFPSPMHQSESEVAQSCLTPIDPVDCSLPGSSIHGIFQARVLEWGAIAFSLCLTAAKSLQSCPTLCDPIDGSHQAPPSLGFSRQEHWSGLQCRRPWLNSWVGKIPWRRDRLTSLVAQLVKNPPSIKETWVRSLGWKDPLEKGMATHSSILTWRIPWTVQPMGSKRVG